MPFAGKGEGFVPAERSSFYFVSCFFKGFFDGLQGCYCKVWCCKVRGEVCIRIHHNPVTFNLTSHLTDSGDRLTNDIIDTISIR